MCTSAVHRGSVGGSGSPSRKQPWQQLLVSSTDCKAPSCSSPLTPHHTPLTPHHTLTSHLSHTSHRSPLTSHPSPLTPHLTPLIGRLLCLKVCLLCFLTMPQVAIGCHRLPQVAIGLVPKFSNLAPELNCPLYWKPFNPLVNLSIAHRQH